MKQTITPVFPAEAHTMIKYTVSKGYDLKTGGMACALRKANTVLVARLFLVKIAQISRQESTFVRSFRNSTSK